MTPSQEVPLSRTAPRPPQTVVSDDGTRIAFDTYGRADGEPVVIVGGAFSYRAFKDLVRLAELLEDRFQVVSYDRRGRGDSDDNPPGTAHDTDSEVADLRCVIDAVGGSAHVYGLSSGAALALRTAAAHPERVRSLALYEAPYLVDDTGRVLTREAVARVQGLVDSGRRGAVVKAFLREVEVPPVFIHLMPLLPAWGTLKSLAHTVPYDFALLLDDRGGRPYPAGSWNTATMPTLVIDGSKSPASMRTSMRALAEHLPAADYRTLEGQTHVVKPAPLAPVLREFFAAHASIRPLA
jgi:pimeloyl-ACP methyl ester carboxylesterase